MNNKGITTVELLVSFLLTSIVVLFIFEMIFTLKELYVSYGIKTELLTKQAIMSEKINDELYNKEISSAEKCGEYCISFGFSDGTTSNLEFNREDKIFKYGNYTTELITGSQYGNVVIATETVIGVDPFKNNSIVRITMPIIHPLLKKQDFGINIIYQYNNQNASLSNVFVADYLDVEKKIYLTGSANDVAFEGITYEDPGFYTVTSEGLITEDDTEVIVTGMVETELNKTYQIKYTVLDTNDIVISTRVRNVTLVNSVNVFSYTGKVQNFNAPVSGEYKVELWGAQGGTVLLNSSEGGLGGYTVGNIELSKGESFSIYVGGQGKYTHQLTTTGGYNGGGASGAGTSGSGASGGGATDIRLTGITLSDRVMIAGGGGGAGSNLDDFTTGGVGGGLVGKVGTYPTISYNGSPGTATEGGLAAIYDTSVTVFPTSGTLGIGGNGGTYTGTNVYGGGGGGGGYYGGGGGVRYGTGAGGSGYCDALIMSCLTHDGDTSFASPTDYVNETGHSGNGYVRITLISVLND